MSGRFSNMHPFANPFEVVLIHDVLCGWSWLADQRLRLLQEEMGSVFRLEYRPFAAKFDSRVPSRMERLAEASNWRKVGREPDGKGIVPDLWRSNDPPLTSLPPLVALEAARIVGGVAGRDRLLVAMRQAAFFHGINISRDDVILELAEKVGLHPERFANAYGSSTTQGIVVNLHEEAVNRGIDAVPAVILDDDWLIAGTRSIEEYRSTIQRFVEQRGLWIPTRVLH